MGQRETFSASDIGKINRMYQCNRKPWLGFGSTANGPATFPSPTSLQYTTRTSTHRPSSNFGSISTNTVGGGEDRNPFREIFKAYTSPQFWQRLLGAWLFSQPQLRHQQPEQTYSDLPYANNPYFYNQGYYG